MTIWNDNEDPIIAAERRELRDLHAEVERLQTLYKDRGDLLDLKRAEIERLLRVNAELIAVLNSIGRTANQAAHMGEPKP